MLLQHLIPPGRRAAASRDFSPDALRRRLDERPFFDVAGNAQVIIDELVAFNSTPAFRADLLAALDVFYSHAEAVVSRLEMQLATASQPLPPALRNSAQLLGRILTELGHAYGRAVVWAERTWRLWGYRPTAYVYLVRALDSIARRIALAHRLHATPPSGAWAAMHELHAIANRWKLSHRDIYAPRTSAATTYRRALLLELAEPLRMGQGDLRRVQEYVRRFGGSAQLVNLIETRRPDGVFVVDVHRDRAGTPKAVSPGLDLMRGFLLVTRPLIGRLGRQLAALEKGAHPLQIGLGADASHAYYRTFLQRLLDSWTGFRHTRGNRTQFRPRAEVVVGLDDAWTFLRQSLEPPGQSLEPITRPRLDASDWLILNESPGGYALRHVEGAIPPVKVGQIVGVRPRDRAGVRILIVRWIKSEHATHLDVGLQEPALSLWPVLIGSPGSDRAHYVRALFAPPTPRFNRVPALIAPARVVRAQRILAVRSLHQQFHVRVLRVLDSTQHLDIHQATILAGTSS
jgi:hypothetical protein